MQLAVYVNVCKMSNALSHLAVQSLTVCDAPLIPLQLQQVNHTVCGMLHMHLTPWCTACPTATVAQGADEDFRHHRYLPATREIASGYMQLTVSSGSLGQPSTLDTHSEQHLLNCQMFTSQPVGWHHHACRGCPNNPQSLHAMVQG